MGVIACVHTSEMISEKILPAALYQRIWRDVLAHDTRQQDTTMQHKMPATSTVASCATKCDMLQIYVYF